MKESFSRGGGVSIRSGPRTIRAMGYAHAISRPSAERSVGFSSRAFSTKRPGRENPGLSITSYINPNIRKGFEGGLFSTKNSVMQRKESPGESADKKTKRFTPFDSTPSVYKKIDAGNIHRRRPNRSFHDSDIRHNADYKVPETQRNTTPVVQRFPAHIRRPITEVSTPYYTLQKKELKKAEGIKPQILDTMPKAEIRKRTSEMQRLEQQVARERAKARAIELPVLPRDSLRVSMDPMLRAGTARLVKTTTDRRTQLKPLVSTEVALKTRPAVSMRPESMNADQQTLNDLAVQALRKPKADQETEMDEEKRVEKFVLFELKKMPLEKDEPDEMPMFDRDTSANSARKERITKAIKLAITRAKKTGEEATGKDVVPNLPKKPTEDVMSELAKEVGLGDDGSWRALVYAMQAVQKLDYKINTFVQSAIDIFTAVRRRKKPSQPATKENAMLVIKGGLSTDDSLKSNLAA